MAKVRLSTLAMAYNERRGKGQLYRAGAGTHSCQLQQLPGTSRTLQPWRALAGDEQ